MVKDDAYRLAAIRRMGSELLSYVREYGITANKIMSDHVVQWTLATPLYNIGEQVHHLSSELKEANPDIPGSRSLECAIGSYTITRAPIG